MNSAKQKCKVEIEIPGKGHATSIVWGNQIIIQTAVPTDKVFVQWDHQKKSYLYALDKKTGKEVWTAEREEITSWATPLIVEVRGKAQLIIIQVF